MIVIQNPSSSQLYLCRFARTKSVKWRCPYKELVVISQSDLFVDLQKIVTQVHETLACGLSLELSSTTSQFLDTNT